MLVKRCVAWLAKNNQVLAFLVPEMLICAVMRVQFAVPCVADLATMVCSLQRFASLAFPMLSLEVLFVWHQWQQIPVMVQIPN